MVFDDFDLSERRSPELARFDEQRSVDTADNAEKYEHQKFKNMPIRDISDFEQHNLVCAVRVQELQGESSNDTTEECSEKCLGREVIAGAY